MLEQIDLTKKMTKEAYQEGIDSLKSGWPACRESAEAWGFRSYLFLKDWMPLEKGYRLII